MFSSGSFCWVCCCITHFNHWRLMHISASVLPFKACFPPVSSLSMKKKRISGAWKDYPGRTFSHLFLIIKTGNWIIPIILKKWWTFSFLLCFQCVILMIQNTKIRKDGDIKKAVSSYQLVNQLAILYQFWPEWDAYELIGVVDKDWDDSWVFICILAEIKLVFVTLWAHRWTVEKWIRHRSSLKSLLRWFFFRSFFTVKLVTNGIHLSQCLSKLTGWMFNLLSARPVMSHL